MAFTCKECHDEQQENVKKNKIKRGKRHTFESHIIPHTSIGISRGPCETCGKIRDCVDCLG